MRAGWPAGERSRQALSLRLGYCTSKAAVEHFTRTLAYEWGRYNIRVNAIAPGYIKSDMNADLRANPEVYDKKNKGKRPCHKRQCF